MKQSRNHLRPSPAKANLVQRVPLFIFQGNLQNRTCLKGPPFGFFSALCDFFSENFLMSPKGFLRVFLIFCNGMYVNKSRRVPLLNFLALCDFFLNEKIFSKISFFFQKKSFALLSLRYGADFRRSRLVSSKSAQLFTVRLHL